MKTEQKNCTYPDCLQCSYEDCQMDEKDINALLKRRRYHRNPELYRMKQRDYRNRVAESLPHCDKCTECILVKNQKGNGFRRLCVKDMRLIEQKVSNSPRWCEFRKRGGQEDGKLLSADVG